MIDAIAFKELYKTVYQDLYRFSLCMMHHPQDAEDAVSEAVLSAYENIHKLRKEEAFRSWIFQILANDKPHREPRPIVKCKGDAFHVSIDQHRGGCVQCKSVPGRLP